MGILLTLLTAVPAHADVTSLYTSPAVAVSNKDTEQPSKDIGTRKSDILVGTGRYSMYLLSKANIISKTDFVSIGIKRMVRGTDYSINYNTGSLQFNSVVKAGDSIRVDYRYKGDGSPVRNVVDPSTSLLKFGSDKSNAVMSFGYRTADASTGASAADVLTYGLNTNMSFNNSTKLTGLLFSATPESPNRIDYSAEQKTAPRQTGETTAKKGNLLVQNLDSKLGKVAFTATYQSVDQTFQGFQTMRESGKVDQNVINQLEKQKGTKRTGFTAMMPTGKNTSLQVTNDTLADTTGAIKTQSISLGGPKLQMNMKTIDNSKDFTHYTDDQQRKESGIKRTYSDFKLADKFGTLAFSSNRIQDNRSDKSAGIDTQAMSFQTASLSISMTSRNIDKNFVRGNDLAEAERAQLASERGIKRNTMSIAMRTSKTSSLAFNSSTIKDNLSGQSTGIDARGFSFTTTGMTLSVNTRVVDKGFTRANDLAEADKAQIGAEVGTKRTATALSMRTGKKIDKSAAWSSFSESRIDADNTHYARRNMDATLGKLRVQAISQTMDRDFNRIAALNWNDRVEMALAARKQFDVNSSAGQVNQDDINRTYNETGLNRSNYAFQFDDKGYAITAAMSNIKTTDASQGGVQRTAFTLNTPKYNLYYKRHDIDAKFNRLSSLQPIEMSNYGNEVGMARVEYGATTKLLGGNVNYMQSDINDSTKSTGITRSSFDYSGKLLKIKANFLNVPTAFTRIGDLSNTQADKDYLASEYGFNRKDYWANFQANSALNLDAYVYDSSSVDKREDKNQRRFSVNYSPRVGPHITAFSDTYDDSSQVTGNVKRYDHRILTFNQTLKPLGGLYVAASRETKTEAAGLAAQTEYTVDTLHFDKNVSKYTKLAYDSTDITTNTGYSEDTKKYSLETPISRDLAIGGSFTTKNLAGENNDEENYVLSLRYALNSKLSMTFDSVVNSSKAGGVNRSTRITASGLLAKRFGPLSDITINTNISTDETRQRETGRVNKTNLSAGFLGGTLAVDNSEVLNPQTGVYSPVRKTTFATGADPKRWYHLQYQTYDFRDSTGKMVKQDNASATVRLNPRSSFTMNTYRGTQQANTPNNATVILPISGNRYTYSNQLNMKQSLYGDYSVDQDENTDRRARSVGLGTKGDLSSETKYDLYAGWARLVESNRTSNEAIYRVSVDCKINSDQFMVFSAQKKSNLEKNTINADEGKTVFKLDYRSIFN